MTSKGSLFFARKLREPHGQQLDKTLYWVPYLVYLLDTRESRGQSPRGEGLDMHTVLVAIKLMIWLLLVSFVSSCTLQPKTGARTTVDKIHEGVSQVLILDQNGCPNS